MLALTFVLRASGVPACPELPPLTLHHSLFHTKACLFLGFLAPLRHLWLGVSAPVRHLTASS